MTLKNSRAAPPVICGSRVSLNLVAKRQNLKIGEGNKKGTGMVWEDKSNER